MTTTKGKKTTTRRPEMALAASDSSARAQVVTVLPDEDAPASREEIKVFLHQVRDKLADESAAPIYGMAAVNHLFNRPEIYEHLDEELKELARDVWLRLEASGLQVRKPPMLFAEA